MLATTILVQGTPPPCTHPMHNHHGLQLRGRPSLELGQVFSLRIPVRSRPPCIHSAHSRPSAVRLLASGPCAQAEHGHLAASAAATLSHADVGGTRPFDQLLQGAPHTCAACATRQLRRSQTSAGPPPAQQGPTPLLRPQRRRRARLLRCWLHVILITAPSKRRKRAWHPQRAASVHVRHPH
jgi:hypothetical protein